MNEDDAIARVKRLYQRRLDKAAEYRASADAYEERALSADEVLHVMQREFLVELGMRALSGAKAMQEDAEALRLLLLKVGAEVDAV